MGCDLFYRRHYSATISFRYLIAFKNLLRSIESLGIASVYGINYFGRGTLGDENYVSYVRHDSIGRDLLNGSLTYVPGLKQFYSDLTRTMSNYGLIKSRYEFLLFYESSKRPISLFKKNYLNLKLHHLNLIFH